MSSLHSPMFISFEGIDGCGKSTQVKLLMRRLINRKIDTTLIREPGGTKISEEIRNVLLKNRNVDMVDRTEALLMTASRAQLTYETIIPGLKKGNFIIADRFSDSTLAYQGGGRGVDLNWLIRLNKFATFGHMPDLTFFMDVSVDTGIKRRTTNNPDRFENAGYEFQEKVRNRYLKLVKLFPKRFVTIDGAKSMEVIHKIVWNNVKQRMKTNEE